jgi:hypothetical protein
VEVKLSSIPAVAGKPIGEVANYKPVSQCSMEELAARQRTIKPSSGVLFARNADGEEKQAARQQVLDLFHPNKWNRPLHILTMPSVQWRFERLLLAAREEGWFRRSFPSRTVIMGVENDRAIYFAGIAQMPGLHTPDALMKRVTKFPFAEQAVKTKYATSVFATIEDVMAHDWEHPWDAAWLDYTGQLTAERMDLIAQFYKRCISEVLVVTALKARWDKNANDAIDAAGGYFQWLRRRLPGEVLHELDYYDTSPMAQFAVRKTQTAIEETKITFIQREQGEPTVPNSTASRKVLLAQFGDLPVVEAKDPLRLQPMRCDVENAIPKDPGCCIFARAAQRQFGATRVFFWRWIAYVDLVGKDGIRRVERFIVNPKMRDLIESFDRGEPIEEGRAFILSPPSRMETRAYHRRKDKVYSKTPMGQAKQIVHKLRAQKKHAMEALAKEEVLLDKLKGQRSVSKKKLTEQINTVEGLRAKIRLLRAKERAAITAVPESAPGKPRILTKPRMFDVRQGSGHYNLVSRA